jgi:hypothetical protein
MSKMDDTDYQDLLDKLKTINISTDDTNINTSATDFYRNHFNGQWTDSSTPNPLYPGTGITKSPYDGTTTINTWPNTDTGTMQTILVEVEEINERLKNIEETLLILRRDTIIEEKYPMLKEVYDKYMETLQNLKNWEILKAPAKKNRGEE